MITTGDPWPWKKPTENSKMLLLEPSLSGSQRCFSLFLSLTVVVFFLLFSPFIPLKLNQCSPSHLPSSCVVTVHRCAVAGTAGSRMFSSLWVTKATMARRVFASSWTSSTSICLAARGLFLHSLLCWLTTPAPAVNWRCPFVFTAQRVWNRCAGGRL